MKGYLDKFGFDSGGAEDLYQRASGVNATKEGSLFQIMVPKDKVDDVAYMAHPHGLPHDDELLEDLHGLSPIRYPKRAEAAAAEDRGLPPREKMNDEITRNLTAMREAWQSDPVEAPPPIPDESIIPKGPASKQMVEQARPALEQRAMQATTARIQQQTRELNERTVARFRRGDYRPSRHLENYIHDPGTLQHPQGEAQKLRMQTNPEHFGGQGMRSPHEVMRIQNRANFMQARMLLSQSHMLNPDSGIRIKRHTTMAPEKEEEYNRMPDDYVEGLFRNKGRKSE
jgi:hypothetical protein